MLYYSLIYASLLLAVILLVYRNREFIISLLATHLQQRVPSPLGGYSRAGDWGSSIRAGLNSTLFDIEANVRDGDSRSGLDEGGAMDIQRIMQQYGVSFDEARLIRHKQALANNNIDPLTGLPLDSKAVTSLGGTVPGSSRATR